jgi:hypothetical protein
MAGNPFGLEPDPRLVSGDSGLIAPAFGKDELESIRAPSGARIVIEDTSPAATRVLLADLVKFNLGSSGVVPAIRVPTQVRLIDEATETLLPGLFHLDTEDKPPFARSLFTLRRIIERRSGDEVRAEAVARELDDLQAALDSEDEDGLERIIGSMLLEREAALADLRHVADLHRDAAQNAVDIVQTKRIDFLENPFETGIEGSLLGFVVSRVAEVVLPSAMGLVFGTVAQGAFMLIGMRGYLTSKVTISAFIKKRNKSIEAEFVRMRNLEGTKPASRSAGNRKRFLLKQFKAEIEKQAKDIQSARLEQRLLLQEMIKDAEKQASDLRLRFVPPKDKAESVGAGGGRFTIFGQTIDPVSESGQFTKTGLAKKLTDLFKEPSGAKQDTKIRNTPIPVDVAMKVEVQNYFDPWVDSAATGVALFRNALFVLRTFGTLPDSTVSELASVAMSSTDLEDATAAMRIIVENSARARADITDFYELLLWLTMYRPRLSRVPQFRRTYKPDRTGRLPEPVKLLPLHDKGTMNLLRYLSQRFFGKGKIVGEGGEAELKIENAELLEVYIELEHLCAAVFEPHKGRVAGKTDILASALADIRFSVMKYE